jgi:hypothetical protein
MAGYGVEPADANLFRVQLSIICTGVQTLVRDLVTMTGATKGAFYGVVMLDLQPILVTWQDCHVFIVPAAR